MTAPRNPWTQVVNDAHPKLTTKSGIANGTTTSTAQIRRPGRSVRSTHQAVSVPMTAQSKVTTTVRRTVFHRRVAVKGLQIRCRTVETPTPCASISKKTKGAMRTSATAPLVPRSPRGVRLLRAGTITSSGASFPVSTSVVVTAPMQWS